MLIHSNDGVVNRLDVLIESEGVRLLLRAGVGVDSRLTRGLGVQTDGANHSMRSDDGPDERIAPGVCWCQTGCRGGRGSSVELSELSEQVGVVSI